MISKRDGISVEQMSMLDTRESQCSRILQYMIEHGSVSLFSNLGKHIGRIPARIGDLKKRGYNITATLRKYYENGRFAYNYAEYRIHI